MINWLKKIWNKDDERKKTEEVSNEINLENNTDIYKFKLNSYSEVVYIAKILVKKEKVLINLNELEKNERRRVLDFLSGIIFFQNGKVKKIKNHIYFFNLSKKL